MLCSLAECAGGPATRAAPAQLSEWASLLRAVRTPSDSHVFASQSLAGDQNYFWPGLITRSHFTACLLPALSHGGPAFPCDSRRQTTSHHGDERRLPPPATLPPDPMLAKQVTGHHWFELLGVFSSRVQDRRGAPTTAREVCQASRDAWASSLL